MKVVRTVKWMILASGIIAFVGCSSSSKGSKNVSRGTGWKINEVGGFQYNTGFKEQKTAPGMVFIEGGTFVKGQTQDDVMHDWNSSPTQMHVQSFYMDETEVTNIMYLEYLDWLKRVYSPDDPQLKNIYYGALPDTLVWRNRLGYNEVNTENYLRHPGYSDYPVVGVSWVQAVEYCEWRTDRVNELELEQNGFIAEGAHRDSITATNTFSAKTYLASPTQTYGGDENKLIGERTEKAMERDSMKKFVKRSDGIIMPSYRLPTETEWEYAARGMGSVREYNNYRGRKKYPWDGAYTRNARRKRRGDHLANFKQGRGDYGGIAGWSDDGADITAPVKSYPPNDFGLYDMSGNVSEWVADVYRPIVDDEMNDFNYYRGNVYMKQAIGKEGKVQVVTTDEIVYDTLSNGRIVARNFPGELVEVPVDDTDTRLRTNFNISENRDFSDGDHTSSRDYRFEESESKRGMYNSPIHEVNSDSLGTLAVAHDRSNKRTTLISNEVRVYKGGSWRDRAYWLDPAQRRFLPQYMATDYIGFRSAMSRVGSKSKKKSKRPKG